MFFFLPQLLPLFLLFDDSAFELNLIPSQLPRVKNELVFSQERSQPGPGNFGEGAVQQAFEACQVLWGELLRIGKMVSPPCSVSRRDSSFNIGTKRKRFISTWMTSNTF